MKLKAIIIRAATVISLGFIVAPLSAFAAPSSYYPPERVHCTYTNQELSCEGFNHQYLVEDTHTADFDNNRDQVFSFESGAAYYNSDRTEVSVFYTYNNSQHKNVRLRTASTSIRPDFEHGNWVRTAADIFRCDSGYMQCPITSLPSNHKI